VGGARYQGCATEQGTAGHRRMIQSALSVHISAVSTCSGACVEQTGASTHGVLPCWLLHLTVERGLLAGNARSGAGQHSCRVHACIGAGYQLLTAG
jgi:hypothetical protein